MDYGAIREDRDNMERLEKIGIIWTMGQLEKIGIIWSD